MFKYHTIALISHTSKVMLKILQARLQQSVNCEHPDVQAGFRKGRGTRDQIAHIRCIIESESEVTQSCPTLCDPWTVAHQAPPSMGFTSQEYWSGLPLPSPGDLPNPGIEPRSPTLQADALPSEPLGKYLR